MQEYILALDQGTTSSRAIVFDAQGNIIAKAQQEFPQIYPEPGWVEHDPMVIWETQIAVAEDAKNQLGESQKIAAIGISNQRETVLVWDRVTGEPIYNAIVWQCRRTKEECQRLVKEGYAPMIQQKTGLVVDSYFSATKIKWILDHVPEARSRANAGELLFGTIDTWLLYRLTKGKVHATDCSNASRTMLFNIHKGDWDEELLTLFDIPRSMLPELHDSSYLYGVATEERLAGIPIGGMIGDQQAALFGQRCFAKGSAKITYGTGCFLLMNTGKVPVYSERGLLTTVAWKLDGQITYALEGSIFIAGALIQWLRDEMGLLKHASESEQMAKSVLDNGGVYLVPAFTGLGAPYWDMDARGIIVGLTRGSNKNHLVRAALEAICYQVKDVLDLMMEESGVPLRKLRVDGGAVTNDFLMQFQSQMLDTPVIRPKLVETTAFGAATLAGLATGFYSGMEDLDETLAIDRVFKPEIQTELREQYYHEWRRAVERSQHWIENRDVYGK
ncbi:glycerol kinase GlpK [Clostridia bacterium]|nr:glycerol kinase GlpK [Clostridia bacterium]